MKKTTLCLSFLIFHFSFSAAQKLWTIDDCIAYAMEHNITLQKSRLQLASTAEDVRSAKGALLPTLNANTNQSLGYRPWQDNGTATVTNGMVNTKVDKTYYNGSYGLNVQWTVWNGNRNRNSLKQSRLSERQAALANEEQANSIQERIAQLFVQCLYLNEAIGVAQTSLETSRKNEERGKEMVDVGKMSKASLAQLTAQRATDEYGVVSAQSQLATYKLQLKQLLELKADQDFDIAIPAATDAQATAAIPDLHDVYDQALATRPEIEAKKVAIESSNVGLSIAKAGWLPTLSASGGFTTSTNSLANNGWGSQMKTNTNMSAGLTLSIPIFDGWQTRSQVNKARLQQQQAQLDLMDQQKTLYQTIEGYWLDATTNQQKYRAATVSVESEQQSYDLLNEKFQLGLTNIIELLQGKDKLLSAQQNQLQSKYMTLLNLQLLRFYAAGGK